MYAVEFETSIINGLVQIPTSFEKLQTSTKAKIIILVDEDNPTVARPHNQISLINSWITPGP